MKGSTPDPSQVFGFYVEKEYVGRRVKGSKVKVTWKFACLPDLKTNEVELKHSLVFGKREIKMNGQLVFQKKKMFNGDFHHRFHASGHLLQVTIRDDFEGYVYDLNVDGVPFHRLTRISTEDLEDMRKSKKEAEKLEKELTDSVKQMSFKDFVEGEGKKKKAGSSNLLNNNSDDDSSDDDVEEDLWNNYQQNRQKDKHSETTNQSSNLLDSASSPTWTEDPFSVPAIPVIGHSNNHNNNNSSSSSSRNSTTFDAFASTSSLSSVVSQQRPVSTSSLVSGLEGLDFGSSSQPQPTYVPQPQTNYAPPPPPQQQQQQQPTFNPFGSPQQTPYQPQQQPQPTAKPPNGNGLDKLVNLDDISRAPGEPHYTPPPSTSTSQSTSTAYRFQVPKQPATNRLTTFNSDSITSLYNNPPQPTPTTQAYNNGYPNSAVPNPYQQPMAPNPPPQQQQYHQMQHHNSMPQYTTQPPQQQQQQQQQYNPFL